MLTRSHTTEHSVSTALYSDCERYRYRLNRIWDPDRSGVAFIMLNPSTATELRNDPTIERCERRARMLGYGGVSITNLFAWRETSPAALRRAKAPVGPDNDRVLLEDARTAGTVVAAWGVHGVHLGRDAVVRALLHQSGLDLQHLGLTKDGHPRHPLYVAYRVTPMPWNMP